MTPAVVFAATDTSSIDSNLIQTFTVVLLLGMLGVACLAIAVGQALTAKPRLLRRWIPVAGCPAIFATVLWAAVTGNELPPALWILALFGVGGVIWSVLTTNLREHPAD